MGEATTMQGALNLLVGSGAEIYQDGKWQGNTRTPATSSASTSSSSTRA